MYKFWVSYNLESKSVNVKVILSIISYPNHTIPKAKYHYLVNLFYQLLTIFSHQPKRKNGHKNVFISRSKLQIEQSGGGGGGGGVNSWLITFQKTLLLIEPLHLVGE